MRVKREEDGSSISDGDAPVLFFQRTPKSQDGKLTRADYVHPLYGLDGEVLTQDFPDDHRHHRGVFWAWHQLWVGEMRAGDGWTTEDFLAVVGDAKVFDEGPVCATLRADVQWTSTRLGQEVVTPTPFVAETAIIRAFAATDTVRYVDFEIRLRALQPDVKIGGAENARGYSGFTVRLKPPRDMKIVDESGPLSEDGVNRVSRWIDVTGRSDTEDAVSGVSILAHRSQPEFPPKWLLRHYGMQNLVYPGREPVALSTEKPLVLRHRIAIHRGTTAATRVPALQKAYELGP